MNKPNTTSLSIPDLRNHSSNQSSKPIILKNSYVTWGWESEKCLKVTRIICMAPKLPFPNENKIKSRYIESMYLE